ncbi:TPA: VCBS domain-containing protein, partial [Citrobacter sedlakii]|nr:VCBS domain-containing protein [Citrobacter sedlakii]
EPQPQSEPEPQPGTPPFITDDEGNPIADGATTSDNTPAFGGSGEQPGAQVVIRDGDTVIGEAVVDDQGNWSVTPEQPLADGGHTITTEITRPDGSQTSSDVTLNIDTTAPAGIDPSEVVMTNDSGETLTTGSTVKDATPTFSGSDAEPGSTVVVRDNGNVIASAVVDENGNWSVTAEQPLVDGEHSLTWEAVDAAGNGSGESEAVMLTVDSDAPEAIDPANVVVTNDAGETLDIGSPINDATPTLSGSGAEPGSTVIVRDKGSEIARATVDDQGNWTVTPAKPLAEGEHSLTYEVADSASNSRGESTPVAVTVDTVAPGGVDLSSVVITNEAGENVTASATQTDSVLTFSGSKLEADTTVTVYDGNRVIGQTTVDANGDWRFTTEEGLSDGGHDIHFTVSDAAGNTSAPSESLTLEVASVTFAAADNINTEAAIGFTWPTEQGADGNVVNSGTHTFHVNDGTVVDLSVTATSSAVLNLFSSTTLTLSKYNSSTGQWEALTSNGASNLFGMFGLGVQTSDITLPGLTAGDYRLELSIGGLNLGTNMSIATQETIYQLAAEPTITSYKTAAGNVMNDVDALSGQDGVPHPAQTLVTSVSVTGADGSVVSYAVNASGATVIDGLYGKLTLSANGDYVYEPNYAISAIGKSDSFTYTLTDAATGNTDSANLYIHINSDNADLDVVWDNLEPSDNAVLDTASSNQADANINLAFESETTNTTGTVSVGTPTTTDAFTVGEGDFLTGSLTLSTTPEWITVSGNAMTIHYVLQQQNPDGSWSTYHSDSVVIPAITMDGKQIFAIDLSTLTLGEGTYRYSISTEQAGGVLGATVSLNVAMNATVVSSTDYVIQSYTEATGNVLSDEGTDGTIDHLSSIYTLMYVQAGDTSANTSLTDYTLVTESGVKVEGQYGTLTIYNNGEYVYQPTATQVAEGAQDVFTYALKGANGVVVTATVTINLGVSIEGVSGGPLMFDGNIADDVFEVYDTAFTSLDGKDGYDTLAWKGSTVLTLSDVAQKVSNIEAIDLGMDGIARNVVVDAASIAAVTNESNSLYISGQRDDTVTTVGHWTFVSTEVIDSVFYNRYVSTTGDGTQVWLNIPKDVSFMYSPQTVTGGIDVVTDAISVGSELNDVFNANNTAFKQIDGGDGQDTLVWKGSDTLTLADIAGKVSNIEVLDFGQDGATDKVIIDAASVAAITNAQNTLWLKGESADAITLSGTWLAVGVEIVDTVAYAHYTSTTPDGTTVNLYVDAAIVSGRLTTTGSESASESNDADITAQVTLQHDEMANTGTLATAATSSFTSDTFTVGATSDLQDITIHVSGSGVNAAANSVNVSWSLQHYNTVTYQWETVQNGTQAIADGNDLSVSLHGLNAGEYRVVLDATQSGVNNILWIGYNALSYNVSANIVSTTAYTVTSSSSIGGSVLDNATDNSLLVKSMAAGIVTGAASYVIVTAAGASVEGTYGTLTLHNDGTYTYALKADSTIKLSGSQDTFTYVLSDNSSHTLTLTMGVAVDGKQGGELILEGTVGDDSFTVYDTDFQVVKGGDGHDALVWNGSGNLNLDAVASRVHDIEVINLQHNDSAATLSLTAEDIIRVTDDVNTLYVRGGSEDTIALQGVWERNGETTLNNIDYVQWTHIQPDGTVVNLYVERGVTFVEVANAVTGDVTPDSSDVTVTSVSFNGAETVVGNDGATITGNEGTFTIDGDGNYAWTPNASAQHAGVSESYSYTLSNGTTSTLTFTTGINVDGSEGGELVFNGSRADDVFDVYDTDFVMLNGDNGSDTLSWHSSQPLDLSTISAKVKNIEKIDLLNNSENDSLNLSVQSVLNVTDSQNTLYVDGGNGDTVTLNGSWQSSGVQLVNGISYNLYTATATDGLLVQLYVNDDVGIS